MTNLPDNIQELNELQEKIDVKRNLVIDKALSSDNPDKIIEVKKYFKDVEERSKSNIKSYIFDPYQFSQQLHFKDKPTNVSYYTLRNMGRTPIINAIITTRVEQIAAFSQPCYDGKGIGFMIRKKQGYISDEETEISKQDKAKIEFITDFILNCGNSNNSWHADSFDTFLRKITRDSLELDQLTFEIVRNKKGIPVEYIATDAATFRLADTYDTDEVRNQIHREMVNGYYPTYVQIFNYQKIAEFYPWELCFAIRNQYTDVRLNGYGVSELENIINIVTWSLYSDTYNGKFFSQGSAPKGIIKITGAVNDAKLAEFRQQWQAMVAGVQNAWRTPVMEADKMEWIDLQRNNRDMEFTKWQEYLIKLSCASYKIDPSEIGFPMSGSSDAKPMFEGNNEARLKYSKDKGLRPLLKLIESKINKYIVNALDSDFEFKFVGLDPESEMDGLDMDIKRLSNFMTINEIRQKHSLPDLNEEDLILNPYYFQAWSMKRAEAQQGNMQSNEAMGEEYPEAEDYFNDDHKSPEWDQEDPFVKAFNDYVTAENEKS